MQPINAKSSRRSFAIGVVCTSALAACQMDRPTGIGTAATASIAAPTTNSEVAATTACPTCIFGIEEFVRATGKPVVAVRPFPAVPAASFALDVIGSRGADVTVTLNGATLLSGERPDSMRVPVALLAANVLQVRQSGRPGSSVRVAVKALLPVGLSNVVVSTPTVIAPISPSVFEFNGRVTNYTAASYGNVALRSLVLQGTTRRTTGFRPVPCAPGIPGGLPPGGCDVTGTQVTILPAMPGSDVLVPGPASLVVQVVQATPTDTTVFDQDTVPIVLQPVQVTALSLTPSHLEFAGPGLLATVQGSLVTNPLLPYSLLPGSVQLTSSNAAYAVVSLPEFSLPYTFSSRVIAVAPGAALIRARSPLNPLMEASTLVSVEVVPKFGPDINVSPGSIALPVQARVMAAAQVLAPPYGPLFWSSDAPATATVDATGRIVAQNPGSATITVRAGSPIDPRAATVDVSVYVLQMMGPSGTVLIAANPGSPSGLPTSISVAARVLDPLGTLNPNPLSLTFFTNRSLFGELIGPPVPAPVIVPMPPGPGRQFVWTQLWTPGPAFCCGTYKVFARGRGAFGTFSTNDSLTVQIVP